MKSRIIEQRSFGPLEQGCGIFRNVESSLFSAIKLIHLITILLLLLLPFLVNSQPPSLEFKHITTENGISNSTIEVIFQDSRGFMWFGTRDGLNRFDGYQVIVYKYEAKDTNSIGENYITAIHEDHNNIIWIGTINGLNSFDPAKNKFTRYKHDNRDPGSISSNYVSSILQDRFKRLWISTLGGGINLYRPDSKDFKIISLGSRNNVNCLFEDSRNNLWVGTDQGLHLFDPESENLTSINIYSSDKNADKYSIRIIKEDKTGNLLLGTNDNGLVFFNYQFKTTKQFLHKATDPSSISSSLIRSILVTRNGTVWTGTINGGVDLFDPVSGKFFNYQNEPDNPRSLSQRTVSSMLEDNQGNIWMGTHRGGVNLYMPGIEKFKLYRQEPNINSLSYNDVKAFCEDKNGNIWIGTDGGGLNQFNRRTNSFVHYKYNPYDLNSIGSNEVVHVLEDSEGLLWVSTWGGGLCLFDRSRNNFQRFRNNTSDINSISSNYIQKIFEDRQKNLWVATYYGGLNLFDKKNKKFARIIEGKNKTRLLGNNIVSINEDAEGNLWIGTDDGGLNCLKKATGEFIHYFNNEEKKPDLRIIFSDSKNRLWIGQAGLYLFDKTGNKFSLFTDKAGLATEFIKGMAEDNSGNLWISTSNGITKFNPETVAFRKFNAADGLQGMEFEANAYLKTKDGQLFFGGVNGFNCFYPQNILANNFIPPVYITDLHVQNVKILPGENKSLLKKDISQTDKIILNYDQATFSFGFAALNYTASENNQYAYKLENWDKDWITAGNEKRASYTNVTPGQYTFRVKASNNDGVWNEKGQSIAINITPPFWSQWWFRFAVLALVFTGGFLFFRFRRKLAIQQIEDRKKEEMHQVQLQFFTNISHELRTPLSLILGPVEKLQKDDLSPARKQSYQVIHKNANRLMQLINELMDFRKSESGVLKLHVMPGNAESFLQEISEEFSELAQQKGIKFTVNSNQTSSEVWFDRQIMEKVIINLVGNSFKYTPDGGEITLETFDNLKSFKPSFENELIISNEFKGKQTIYFRVKDNGIGISKDSIQHLFERYYRVSETHMGSGIGLAFVKSLTLLHKGCIHVYSERNKGTEFIVAIPCSRSDYSDNEKWLKGADVGVKLESNTGSFEETTALAHNLKNNGQSSIKPNILIVEDNDELRNFLKQTLETDYRISEASHGKAGMEKVKEEYPDLIISDIMMPEMDGIEFCKRIKEDSETSHIPFMMLTAKDRLESKIEGTSVGADYYFSKPLSTEILELTIKNIFSQKQKLRNRYQMDHHAEVKEMVHSVKGKEFLEELIDIIEANLENPEMNIDYICTRIGMSRTKLYNKVKGLTGQSISDFIRSVRLKKAVHLLTHEDASLTDVMYNVGIHTQSYFTKAFKNEFGKTPTQFLKDLKKGN